MSVLAALERSAGVRGNRPALKFGDARWSYAKLWDRIQRSSMTLRESGIGRSDAVAIVGENSPDYLAGYFGAMLSGAMIVPLNPRSTDSDLLSFLDHVDAAGVIVSDDTRLDAVRRLTGRPIWSCERLYEADADQVGLPADDDPALCTLTTGTTGSPKGVVHSHATLALAASEVADALPYRRGDVSIGFLPFYASIPEHALPVLLTEGCLRVVRRFDVDGVVELCAEAQSFHAVPTIVGRLISQGDHDLLRQLDWIGFASEPMPQPVLEHWWSELPNVRTYQFYGMSELLPITFAPPEVMKRSPGTVGWPFPSATISIVNASLDPVGPGEVGEVVCSSAARMIGYLGDPTQTAASLTATGGMRTGDVGFVDDEGLLHLTGRAKDVIISGGLNIAAGEIERVAATYPGVSSAAVIAAPSDHWGETPVLVVVALPEVPVDLKGLLDHCASQLAGYKRPAAATLLPELPMTGIGKADKTTLKEWLSEGRLELTSLVQPPSRDPLEPNVLEVADMKGKSTR